MVECGYAQLLTCFSILGTRTLITYISFLSADVRERLRAVESEYAQLSTFFSGDPELFLPPFFSFEAFKETFAVVLSRVVFLPSADCFALVSKKHSFVSKLPSS